MGIVLALDVPGTRLSDLYVICPFFRVIVDVTAAFCFVLIELLVIEVSVGSYRFLFTYLCAS